MPWWSDAEKDAAHEHRVPCKRILYMSHVICIYILCFLIFFIYKNMAYIYIYDELKNIA